MLSKGPAHPTPQLVGGQRSADAAADTAVGPGRRIGRDSLINRLNYLNFQGGQVTALLVHQHLGRVLRLKAHPEPLTDAALHCRWEALPPPAVLRGEYALRHLEIPQGRHILKVGIDAVRLSATALSGHLAEDCQLLAARRVDRHACRRLDVKVIQNGAVFSGTLDDFSSTALRMELLAAPPQHFQWLDPLTPVTLIVSDESGVVFTAIGDIVRSSGERLRQTVVIAPRRDDQRRFPAKTFRSRRVSFCPTPQVVFTHPVIGRRFALDVTNLSGTGFAVCESANDAILLPGLTLDDLELRLTEACTLRCKAQAVYCRTVAERDGTELRHCGLAILDMAVPDHTRLMALLHRAGNRQCGVSPPLDLDRLWEFFFASGFIYPEKYRSVHANRHQFLDTYARLYNDAPNIARHFVLQDNGAILAHMAMLRTGSNSWLIHHHAADHAQAQHAGLDVLQLAGETINEAQGLYSAHMGFVMCYYRPENRFPRRIFGGVANHYRNRAQCSVDTFAYFHYRKEDDLHWKDAGAWALTPAQTEDLLDLEAWYEQRGGGVMLKALDMTPQRPDQRELVSGYRQAGFDHQQQLFALKYDGALIALFSTLRTAFGLNLSNLTNAITVFVVNDQALPRAAYFTAISMLAARYPGSEVPVLTCPDSYPAQQQIDVEKLYNLWAIDCRHLDPYFEFCAPYFRRLRSGKDA